MAVAKLQAQAKGILEGVENAPFMTSNSKRKYPTFDHSEIDVGATLGVGGFGIVSEVTAIKISAQTSDAGEGVEENTGCQQKKMVLNQQLMKMSKKTTTTTSTQQRQKWHLGAFDLDKPVMLSKNLILFSPSWTAPEA